MPLFRYKAVSPAGEVVAAEMEAASEADLRSRLGRLGQVPVEVVAVSGARAGRSGLGWPGRRARPADTTQVMQDLALLVKAGITIDEALQILGQMDNRTPVARMLAGLRAELANGRSLAQAMASMPDMFERTSVEMVAVSEASGTLGTTLKRIAEDRLRGEAMRRKIASALAYPSFLIVAALGVLVFVLAYVIPRFETALGSLVERLEPSARLVFELSAWLRAYSGPLMAGLALLLVLGLIAGRSRRARAGLARLLSRLPGIGPVIAHQRTVRLCNGLGTMLSSGVDVTTTLQLLRGLTGDGRSAAELDRVIAEVRNGKRLTDALGGGELLPAHVVHMLRVGESSGQIGAMADRVTSLYEGRLESAISRLTGVLGPAMMVLVAMLVAWVIISVVTALISVNELVL